MKHLHIALLSLLSLFMQPVLANEPAPQRKDLGEIRLAGGVGAATPWEAALRYNLNTRAVRFSPFFGIKGINRQSSATVEDVDFTYTGIAPLSNSADYQYLSHQELRSHGTAINYGATLGVKLTPADQLEASFKQELNHRHTLGNQREEVYTPVGMFTPGQRLLFQAVPSSLDGRNDQNNIEVTAGYTHTFNGSSWALLGGKFDLRYSYLREKEDADPLQTILPGAISHTGSDDYQLLTSGLSQKHRLQADFLVPYIAFLPAHIGAFYENRTLSSDDQQWLGSVLSLDDHFHHRYQTAGAYFKTDFSVKKVKFNVKLEYDYTRMQSQNLNDFVPEVGALWAMNKRNTLQFNYVRRIIRPSLELLNPAVIVGPYTRRFGNPDLIGAHIDNLTLRYMLKRDKVDFTTTLQHIRANDGFCAIWTENNLQRNYTWKNVGKRRAWSVTPEVVWRPISQTTLQAKATVIWDKREAEAIHMAKEHWGITTSARLTQRLPGKFLLGLNCDYSEGNTLDLYSHAGRSINYGGSLQRELFKRFTATISYDHTDAPKTIFTQGGYLGSIHLRPLHSDQGKLTLNYKF